MCDTPFQYMALKNVVMSAVDQAAIGKGHNRHVFANEPFDAQIICWLERRGHTFNTGQAVKKIDESLRLDPEKAIEELLGAINFCAARVMILEEIMRETEGEDNA